MHPANNLAVHKRRLSTSVDRQSGRKAINSGATSDRIKRKSWFSPSFWSPRGPKLAQASWETEQNDQRGLLLFRARDRRRSRANRDAPPTMNRPRESSKKASGQDLWLSRLVVQESRTLGPRYLGSPGRSLMSNHDGVSYHAVARERTRK